jgi:hypothetical protein
MGHTEKKIISKNFKYYQVRLQENVFVKGFHLKANKLVVKIIKCQGKCFNGEVFLEAEKDIDRNGLLSSFQM